MAKWYKYRIVQYNVITTPWNFSNLMSVLICNGCEESSPLVKKKKKKNRCDSYGCCWGKKKKWGNQESRERKTTAVWFGVSDSSGRFLSKFSQPWSLIPLTRELDSKRLFWHGGSLEKYHWSTSAISSSTVSFWETEFSDKQVRNNHSFLCRGTKLPRL